MQRIITRHVERAFRRGSSCPVVVDTARGKFVLKLRGSAQGASALVAELAVAELAERLGLPVPERALVELMADYRSDDGRDELADLLERSIGLNVGFRYLDDARDLRIRDMSHISSSFATATLWLDGLTMNIDRTEANPNVVLWRGGPWLIDNGASLSFQHWWPQVTEDSPRVASFHGEHLFSAWRDAASLVDEKYAALVDRDALEAAMRAVPDELVAAASSDGRPERTRAAYVAFLHKRCKAPRPFL